MKTLTDYFSKRVYICTPSENKIQIKVMIERSMYVVKNLVYIRQLFNYNFCVYFILEKLQ